MSTQPKKWYYNKNNQNEGPFSFGEFQAKITQGVVTKKTSVWHSGLPAWVVASEVELLASSFRKPSQSESSDLLELRPREIDDRTGVIDRESLARARKEAARVHKVAAFAQRKFHQEHAPSKSRVMPLFILASASVVVGLIVTQVSGHSQIQPLLDLVFSPIPTLNEVSALDYSMLKSAAGEPLGQKGVSLVVALSTTNINRPVFVIGGNLPDGTKLLVQLQSDPATLLTDKAVQIQFPLVIANKIAKSNPLHTLDNLDIPIGEYQIGIVEDDDQPPAIKTALAPLPANPPGSQKKVLVIKRFFLGGEKTPEYANKLEQMHQKRAPSSLSGPKMLQDWAIQVQNSITSLGSLQDRIAKAARSQEKLGIWIEFEKSWKPTVLSLPEIGGQQPDWVQAVRNIEIELQGLFDLSKSYATGTTADETGVLTQLQQQTNQVKTRFDEFKNKMRSTP
jgi:hypothetical protein